MHRCLRIAALILFATPFFVYAQAPSPIALPPAPLLPQSFGVWKQTASEVCVGDACAENVVKSGAASKEYGVKRGAIATY